MWGYGEDDELHGGKGDDKIRGATGVDFLTDNLGTDAGDRDKICDGDGRDIVEFEDLDGLDHWHKADDGVDDPYRHNEFDDEDVHQDCPM